jgi:nitroimidazol reductase NimA-like FMN-containing flavoprotein (pyridoxamine 5'-phosphate oxidase superfamily)
VAKGVATGDGFAGSPTVRRGFKPVGHLAPHVSVPDEVERLLTSEPLLAHLATCRSGRPHVAPLWYTYDDGVVEVVTTGRKLADLRANPYVSLSVEKSEAGQPEWMVTLRGTATVVEDEEQFLEVNRRINRKYGAGDDAWDENTLVRIEVGSATHRAY